MTKPDEEKGRLEHSCQGTVLQEPKIVIHKKYRMRTSMSVCGSFCVQEKPQRFCFFKLKSFFG